jgi:hypothetical protein
VRLYFIWWSARIFDITDGQTLNELANFFIQSGSQFFCPGPYPGSITTIPCFGDPGSSATIWTFDDWLNQIGGDEQTEGYGVDENGNRIAGDAGWSPIFENDNTELQIRTEYDLLIFKLIIKDAGQNSSSEMLSTWASGVGDAANFWAGGGNNPYFVDPYADGPEVKIPLPTATPGPYPE